MFAAGLRLIRRLCEDQDPFTWHRAKLNVALFVGGEKPVFEWVDSFVRKHHSLPQLETIIKAYPDVGETPTPEPASYYLEHVEARYFYGLINDANLASQDILKSNQGDHIKALDVLQSALNTIKEQQHRSRIIDVSVDVPSMILKEYYHVLSTDSVAEFGWEYMDSEGPVAPGAVVSFVGRPASGKTYLGLYTTLHNWREHRDVMFVSTEMAPLEISQRIVAMYGHTNISQLKSSGYSTHGPGGGIYGKFKSGLEALAKEDSKFYLIDGNLAASAEDVYMLADQLKCQMVFIDGAYLLRHRNARLDRFTRAAENIELIKRYTSDLMIPTFTSWQFNRDAAKKKKKGEEAGLEDIGYTDAISQISSIVIGLFQEEGVETMKQRNLRVMKGRGGEIGQFNINWDFLNMNFAQTKKDDVNKEMKWI